MIEVCGLFIGDEASCLDFVGPVVHACKHPCYMRIAQRPREKTDPEYLVIETGRDLFLNMIDPPVPLFQARSFRAALDFIDKQDAPPLVHCNQGASRSPSIVLLWLAQHEFIDPSSYERARAEFEKIYRVGGITAYAPGAGIATFLTQHWTELLS